MNLQSAAFRSSSPAPIPTNSGETQKVVDELKDLQCQISCSAFQENARAVTELLCLIAFLERFSFISLQTSNDLKRKCRRSDKPAKGDLFEGSLQECDHKIKKVVVHYLSQVLQQLCSDGESPSLRSQSSPPLINVNLSEADLDRDIFELVGSLLKIVVNVSNLYEVDKQASKAKILQLLAALGSKNEGSPCSSNYWGNGLSEGSCSPNILHKDLRTEPSPMSAASVRHSLKNSLSFKQNFPQWVLQKCDIDEIPTSSSKRKSSPEKYDDRRRSSLKISKRGSIDKTQFLKTICEGPEFLQIQSFEATNATKQVFANSSKLRKTEQQLKVDEESNECSQAVSQAASNEKNPFDFAQSYRQYEEFTDMISNVHESEQNRKVGQPLPAQQGKISSDVTKTILVNSEEILNQENIIMETEGEGITEEHPIALGNGIYLHPQTCPSVRQSRDAANQGIAMIQKHLQTVKPSELQQQHCSTKKRSSASSKSVMPWEDKLSNKQPLRSHFGELEKQSTKDTDPKRVVPC